MMKKFFTGIFYSAIALAGMLAFFVFLYLGLRRDSNIASFVANAAGEPLYFWPYVLLTAATGILFGIGLTALVWRLRAFGFSRRSFYASSSSSGIGSLIGFAASACPVCGSTLLATIGLAGGLTAFPFAGLELKALSFMLIALPLILLVRERKTLERKCAEGLCPAPRDASFQEKDGQILATTLLVAMILALVGWNMLKSDPIMARITPLDSVSGTASINDSHTQDIIAAVLPEQGFRSKISLGGSVQKLIEYGVIDRQKFEALYAERGGIPDDLQQLLDRPSDTPILLTRENSSYYLNLLWPLGLANRMEVNTRSPINGPSLFNFASTGGWVLGKEENGGAYFNKFDIVPLTSGQEALVKRIAENSYRPCCDNSTFFQDCNHGSALLGLLQLGASQGLSEEELWREALAFNSFWFPETYVKIALYFQVLQNLDWAHVDPKTVMGKEYSSASGWYTNVERRLQESGVLLQLQQSGGCGV